MKNLTSLCAVIVFLTLAGMPAWAQWTPTGGGDHAGADWTLTSGDSIAGVHTNIGTFTVPAGATVTVEPYDGAAFGIVEIHATNVVVDGTILGTGLGYRGGAAGNPPND